MTADRADVAATLVAAALEDNLAKAVPDAVVKLIPGRTPTVVVQAEKIVEVCGYLKNAPGLEFDYLVNLTSVDRIDYFEVVYHLYSIRLGHALTVKVQVERDQAIVPSVTGVWHGADFQEREVYDMMGITFTGHHNLKRILLYDEFVGYPLRKDFGLPT
ncbi:MAG: NADH-quinone oxidoreductase subunit C [Chloroflexi bacterium]|nr:NADH-quinone oxidoreductase subunit C [Chloroflexota bacterium]